MRAKYIVVTGSLSDVETFANRVALEMKSGYTAVGGIVVAGDMLLQSLVLV